ncbi:MAG: hypothetical protein LUD72_03035 [Bacteroidales bacterium]|nr:hypothetical protein [Bacteroidales bacterium]
MTKLKRPLKANRREPDDMVYAYSIARMDPKDGIQYGHEVLYCSDKKLPIGLVLNIQGTLFRVQREEVRFKREAS